MEKRVRYQHLKSHGFRTVGLLIMCGLPHFISLPISIFDQQIKSENKLKQRKREPITLAIIHSKALCT